MISTKTQSENLDERLSSFIGVEDRENIWESANRILDMADAGKKTVMGLGYVQSGKTTSISALCAAAADRGYGLVVALLGSTNLLKDQNRTRVEEYLGLGDKNYLWYSISEFNSPNTKAEIQNYLERGRTVLLPVIKNATVIKKVASILGNLSLGDVRTLVIDDEADQGSLNTKTKSAEVSSTFSAIAEVRQAVGSQHLFVQYTATPYAPLLLEDDDPLMPEDLEFLKPGEGYTGGREFFIEHQEKVVRVIPEVDEQTAKSNLNVLPNSLEKALASFLAGATHLFNESNDTAPVSMLIHSTFKNDLQDRYRFLVDRYLKQMKAEENLQDSYFGALIASERQRLYDLGVPRMDDNVFWSSLSFTLRETTLWLVNSATDVKQIKWNSAPFHILLGGNKLDRGFTVEGLTVTYMNRTASAQIDTLEQRARAFGYRTNLLPFCQFFATAKTLKLLVGIVHTEDDLRASLRDTLDQGGTVQEWSKKIGLLLPSGAKASRANVLPALTSFNPDGEWQSMRRPSLDLPDRDHNRSLLQALGVFSFAGETFGRMKIKHGQVTAEEVANLLEKWRNDPATPGWRHEEIIEYVKRSKSSSGLVEIFLMEAPGAPGAPRIRRWEADTGFVNLFQGRDVSSPGLAGGYPGDREFATEAYGEEGIFLQIHRISRRGYLDEDLFTLAIRLQGHSLTRKTRGIK